MGRSDAPKNPTPAAGKPATFDRVVRYMAQAWIGVAGAAAMFAAFVTYAYVAPATYRTTAQLILEPASKEAKLPAADELARSVERAALDDVTVRELAAEAAGPGGDKLATARRIRNAFEVDTADGRTFNLTFSDGTAARAQSVLNRLAKQAAKQVPELLAATAPRPLDERRQRTAELTAFLAEHPEVADAPLAPEEKTPDEASDPVSAALRAERRQLESELAARTRAGSDNPYDDPAAIELTGDKLQRRLNEINTALVARAKALKRAPAAGARLAPDVEAEWRRLLQAVAQAKSTPAPAEPAPVATARVVEAPLPGAPISPDRRAVLLLGAFVTLGTGISLGLGATALARRRPKKRAGSAALGAAAAPVAVPARTGMGQTLRAAPVQERGLQPAPAQLALPPAGAPQAGAGAPPAVDGVVAAPPAGQSTFLTTMPSRDAELPRGDVAPAAVELRPNLGGAIQPSPVKTLEQPPTFQPQIERILEPKRTAVGLGVPPELLQAEVITAPAAGAPGPAVTAAPTDAAPRNAGSDPPRAVVEINATENQHAAAEAVEAEAPAETAPRTERLDGRASPARRTQMLGSPIPPVMPANKRSGPPPDYAEPRERAPKGGTGYSYVSSAPPEDAHAPRNRSTPRDPRREGEGYLSTPPPGAPLAGRITVTPYPAPGGWTPAKNLNPGSRRTLCDQLQTFALGGRCVVGLVSTPSQKALKSQVAAELALALGELRHPRVLLLEGDFHWPSVHRVMRVDMPLSTGFSQQLRAFGQQQRADRFSVVECSPTLHVLAEGMMRSPGLLLTKQFEASVSALMTYYNVIVVDGPATDAEVDCRALASVLDGVIAVGCSESSPEFEGIRRLVGDVRFTLATPG